MTEKWKDVVGYEGLYKVSNFGNVKSLGRVCDAFYGDREVPEKMLTKIWKKNRVGELKALSVSLNKERKCKTFTIARLVLEAFVGLPVSKDSVAHVKDGNPFNLEVKNLIWDTRKNIRRFSVRNKKSEAENP